MILLTGATGFVGSIIYRLLKEKSDQAVVAIGRRQAEGITICDLLSPQDSDVRWEQIESVIHCAAAIPAVSKVDSFDNVRMTQSLLGQFTPQQLKSFVMISSVAVYPLNDDRGELNLEESCTLPPLEQYGRSKLIQEWLVSNFAQNRIPVTFLRPSSIYGAGNTSRTLLPIFIEKARGNEPVVLKGSRRYVQNFVHVDDVAHAAVASALGAYSGTYNVFSDETFSPKELAEYVIQYFDSNSKIIDEQVDTAYPRLHFDNNRYVRKFERSPLLLEQGLARI
jgi:UDP-glucose 4-epimerase